MNNLTQEARIFAQYLLHREPSPGAIRLYISAMEGSQPSASDQKLLDFMTKHPRLIGLIDAGLIFHNSTSEARRRLYLMLAILEAQPENTDMFLPTKRSPFYFTFIVFAGARAAIKATLGLLLVKVVA
jgi:hypothetical protein